MNALDARRHSQGRLILVRHGETAWSRTGRYTGRTDLPLTREGERQASTLHPYLAGREYGAVLTSPLSRARRTAALAGFTAEVEQNLVEWDYGPLEGRTEHEITTAVGRYWSIWDASAPDGFAPREPLAEVATRADQALGRVLPVLETGSDVLVFAHAHLLHILAARLLQLPSRSAAKFALSPASASVFSCRDSDWAVVGWNFTPWRCHEATRPQPLPTR
ncbi:putative phosphoglycerate mutase [Kribbella pratensis]|uniref:Phosphoglycerate mutase n=1 Tax=Kribbella pratensis TaxID=2512112 RepID=A0ABY2FJZ9_9ACTN|nr:histidine phosphatase family protein [Kribbella pratensis]TDW93454.1 putative phosphoglycerate mutase [Kribbella pratensis]